MKKQLLLLVMLACGISQAMAQNTIIDRSGTASFFSEAPIEDIEATNDEVLGAIDMSKGVLAVSMLMTGFDFDKSLMEEHFNENYLESDKFPKASFKGVINDFAELNFTENGSFEADVEGVIELHGVQKPFQAVVKFTVLDDQLSASTDFEISIADFNIEIPKLVIKNIAEVVQVKASFKFSL